MFTILPMTPRFITACAVALCVLALPAGALAQRALHWDSVEVTAHRWVDIVGQELHVFNPADGTDATHKCPDIVTSMSPRAAGGVLLTLRRTFALFDGATGRFDTIAEVEPDMPGMASSWQA